MELLVVEDDDIDYRILTRTLRKLGVAVQVSRARDGREALDPLQAEPERIAILLDLNMPRMDGFEFLEALQQQGETLRCPVYVMTTSDRPQDRDRVLALGATGFVRKADDPAEFMRSVGSLMDSLGVPRA